MIVRSAQFPAARVGMGEGLGRVCFSDGGELREALAEGKTATCADCECSGFGALSFGEWSGAVFCACVQREQCGPGKGDVWQACGGRSSNV